MKKIPKLKRIRFLAAKTFCIGGIGGLSLFSTVMISSVASANAGVGSGKHTGNEAMQLLNRMHHALHQLNYNGTLVYSRNNSLSTLHIDHSIVNGVERERVVRLNEQGSEVSRELKGFSLASIPVIRPEMNKIYSFDLGRENRVANIPCRIITARPKDRVRYLQKFCIDTNTGFLLDYMLVGKSHKPVEQFMFTSVEINQPEAMSKQHKEINNLPLDIEMEMTRGVPPLKKELVTPLVKAESITITPQSRHMRHISSSELDDGWVMETLPAGFEISEAPQMKQAPDDQGVTRHYVVSDGLSSLSVFLSPLSEHAPRKAIEVNSGALNMISRHQGNYMITIVGEVPDDTLKSVANSLRQNRRQDNSQNRPRGKLSDTLQNTHGYK